MTYCDDCDEQEIANRQQTRGDSEPADVCPPANTLTDGVGWRLARRLRSAVRVPTDEAHQQLQWCAAYIFSVPVYN